MGLGVYHRENGDFAAAARELELAAGGLPNESRVFAAIAAIRWRLGDLDAARRHFEKAFLLDPRSAEWPTSLGMLATARRDYEQADALYARALELQPDHLAAAAIRYRNSTLWKGYKAVGFPDSLAAEARRRGYGGYESTIAVRLGRYDEALELIDAMTADWVEGGQYYPRDLLRAWVYTFMGEAEKAAKAYESARRTLEELLAQAPDDARIHSALGQAYAGLGRKEEAIRHGRRSVELVPNPGAPFNWPYRLRLACIYAVVGEPDLALDLIDEQLSLPVWVSVAELEEEPFLDGIRDHPRYRELLRKYGRPRNG